MDAPVFNNASKYFTDILEGAEWGASVVGHGAISFVFQFRLGLQGKFNRKAYTFPIRMHLKANMYAYIILYKNITCIYNHAGKNKQ